MLGRDVGLGPGVASLTMQAGTVRNPCKILRMESVGAMLRLFDRVRLHRLRKTIVIICFQARVNWKL